VLYFEEKAQPITVRNVAGHLSGIRDYDMKAGEYHNTRRFKTTREAVAVFGKDPLLSEPGTRYSYSAYNFVLLSAALESASGLEFLSYMQWKVFSPLGLRRTGPDRRPAKVPGLVSCYTAGFLGAPTVATPLDVSNKWAAGGFVSTSVEMVRVGNALLTNELLRPETLAVLTTPQKLKDGSDTGFGYGMGWRSGSEKLPLSGRDIRVMHHGGTANGAMSFFVLFPEESGRPSTATCSACLGAGYGGHAIADLFLQEGVIGAGRMMADHDGSDALERLRRLRSGPARDRLSIGDLETSISKASVRCASTADASALAQRFRFRWDEGRS
jgi:hypothetical protein